MRRFARIRSWLLLVVVVVNVAMVWSGRLSARDAVVLTLALELLVWLVILVQAPAAVRRYRHSRAAGNDRWLAAEHGLSELMPARLARWLTYDPRIWACLVGWLRHRNRPLATDEFAYHSGRTTITVAFL